MSGSGNNTSREAAGATGLALLLGGGVAEAMASVEATLASVQGAAARAFAGLSRVQAAGAAAAAVPPVRMPAQPASTQPGTQTMPAAEVRPAALHAPPPATPPAGAEQVATFTPVSVSGGGSMLPIAPAAPTAPPSVAPVMFASFAPPAPTVMGGQSSVPTVEPGWAPDGPRADARAQPWAAPAMAPAAPAGGGPAGAEPARAYAPTASQGGQGGGPTGGDVFLDGMRVGTWLADHLAHEAGRPQRGGTDFDPRLTPAWPGTLQGG